MKSATKPEVSEELLVHLVKNAFSAKPSVIRELDKGFFNATYYIEVENGRRTVLKIAPQDSQRIMRYEKNIMYTEVSVMQKIKRHTDVPVPDLYYYDAAKTSCPSAYFFMEYMDAEDYDKLYASMTDEQRAAIEREVGSYTRSINQIKGHRFGYYGQERRQKRTWYESFSRMLEDILADAKFYNIEFGLDEADFFHLLDADKCYFDEVQEPCLIHWDMWRGNIFVKDAHVVGIIDWERCLWAEPLMEYGFRTQNRTDAFLEGWGHDKEFTKSEQKRIRWYDLYLYMTMAVELRARDYEDEAWDRYVWRNYWEALRILNEDE